MGKKNKKNKYGNMFDGAANNSDYEEDYSGFEEEYEEETPKYRKNQQDDDAREEARRNVSEERDVWADFHKDPSFAKSGEPKSENSVKSEKKKNSSDVPQESDAAETEDDSPIIGPEIESGPNPMLVALGKAKAGLAACGGFLKRMFTTGACWTWGHLKSLGGFCFADRKRAMITGSSLLLVLITGVVIILLCSGSGGKNVAVVKNPPKDSEVAEHANPEIDSAVSSSESEPVLEPAPVSHVKKGSAPQTQPVAPVADLTGISDLSGPADLPEPASLPEAPDLAAASENEDSVPVENFFDLPSAENETENAISTDASDLGASALPEILPTEDLVTENNENDTNDENAELPISAANDPFAAGLPSSSDENSLVDTIPADETEITPFNTLPAVNPEAAEEEIPSERGSLGHSLANAPPMDTTDLVATPDFQAAPQTLPTGSEDLAAAADSSQDLTALAPPETSLEDASNDFAEDSSALDSGFDLNSEVDSSLPSDAGLVENSELSVPLAPSSDDILNGLSDSGDLESSGDLNGSGGLESLGDLGESQDESSAPIASNDTNNTLQVNDANSANDAKIANDSVYVVCEGDNYQIISEKYYGTGAYFKAIARYNSNKVRDPNNLTPGTRLRIPDAAFLQSCYPTLCPAPGTEAALAAQSANVAGSAASYYTVRQGDTLSDIARQQLGSSSRWPEIYRMNREKLRGQFDALIPGMQLELPVDEEIAQQPKVWR